MCPAEAKNSKVVILVHGMGTHPPGNITIEFKKALTDRASSFGLANADFIASADYEEFNYSDYFDAVRKQLADNATNIGKDGIGYLAGRGLDAQLITQLVQFESKMGGSGFFYTHWLDVILYSTTYYGAVLQERFIKFFENLRKKYGHDNIHIVCHSLGTALVHDAMANYYRIDSHPYDDIPDLKAGSFNIASLWTFANVSRMVNVLNRLTDPDKSTVVTGSDGCTNLFFNIRHQYDPFTWYLTYERQMKRGYHVENKVIRIKNTHDFYEYVTAPLVAELVMENIYGVTITDAQLQAGKIAHEKNTLTQQVAQLKSLIDQARGDPSINSIKKAFDAFKKIQEELQKP